MRLVGPDMVINTVDAFDRVTGRVRRADVFAERRNFRVVHLFLFNAFGDLLVQLLPSDQARHPGRWGSSVAGYLFANESYLSAARRRSREELGINNVPLRRQGKTFMLDGPCIKFITLYTGVYDGALNVDRSHIERIEYMSVGRIQQALKTEPHLFTPTFAHLATNFFMDSARR